MKHKLTLSLAIILLLVVSLVAIINAQELSDSGLPPELEKVQQVGEKVQVTGEKLQGKNVSYLQQEWRKKFEKNPAGKIIVQVWDFLKSPLTIITGTPAEISWKFAIAVFLWIMLFSFIFNSFGFFMGSPYSRLAISLVGTILVAVTKAINFVASWIVTVATTWWGKALVFLVIMALLILAEIEGKFAKKRREAQEKQKTEQAQEEVQSLAKGIEEGQEIAE